MACLRANGSLALATLLFAALSISVFATTQIKDFDSWLQYISETSDPVPDGSLDNAKQQVDINPAEGPNQLTGFDAWITKQRDNVQLNTAKSSKQHKTIYVAQDGTGDFSTIIEALNSLPKDNNKRVIIFVKAGTYYERFVIPSSQKYIALVGEGADKSIISGDATAGDEVGDEFLRTYRCCTVCVDSDHFVAKNILIQNTAPAPEPGAVNKQAVALRISGDKASFYNVAILGAQDTLYDHQGRHFFLGCYIQGSIDFIFGNGRSFYKDSHLHSIATSFGSLTAQKRNETWQKTGFSFVNAQIDGTGIVYLGRAWGNYSRVVYSWSYMNEMIIPEGWQDWGIAQRDSEVYYGIYHCYGPGAYNAARVWWSRTLTDAEAKPFLTDAFINGHSWIEHDSKF